MIFNTVLDRITFIGLILEGYCEIKRQELCQFTINKYERNNKNAGKKKARIKNALNLIPHQQRGKIPENIHIEKIEHSTKHCLYDKQVLNLINQH